MIQRLKRIKSLEEILQKNISDTTSETKFLYPVFVYFYVMETSICTFVCIFCRIFVANEKKHSVLVDGVLESKQILSLDFPPTSTFDWVKAVLSRYLSKIFSRIRRIQLLGYLKTIHFDQRKDATHHSNAS